MLYLAAIRPPTVEDVLRALSQPSAGKWPSDEEELLGLFNLILEDLFVFDTDTGQFH